MKKVYQSKIKLKAFTLAEVLITLGIIGVVAAITIPTLINNYQKTQYVTALRKTYAEFNQVLLQITNDYGCNGDLACTGLFDLNTTYTSLGRVLTKYFKIIKNCETTADQGCFPANTNDNFDGSASTNQQFDSASYYEFITMDGVSIGIINRANNCQDDWGTHVIGNMSQVCADVYIDVTGPKGPNNMGRDTFIFYITNGKGPVLYPQGGVDDNNYGRGNYWWNNSGNNRCSNPNKKYGYYCPGRIMEKSWEMDY